MGSPTGEVGWSLCVFVRRFENLAFLFQFCRTCAGLMKSGFSATEHLSAALRQFWSYERLQSLNRQGLQRVASDTLCKR
jgi:hypothetical protein